MVIIMKTITPEQGGISSKAIETYLSVLEGAGLSTHNIIIERGGKILFEKYYPPFHENFLHREYSQTKSLVALAVGFALQDGLFLLDDPIGMYFPEETKGIADTAMAQQTIRQMLMMSTPKRGENWFAARTDDRVRHYFAATQTSAAPGSRFSYDSTGSFILCALVERLTGMRFIAYLRKKLFDKIGVSEGVTCLSCPGGHSWGDSAVLATARDMMKICRFVLDGGKVMQDDGSEEQLLDASFLKEATSALIPTAGIETHWRDQFGYGYQIWKTQGDGFFFNGMGCQFSVAVPEKDMVFIYNGDNQGIDIAGDTIIRNFFEIIVAGAGDAGVCNTGVSDTVKPLEEATQAQQSLRTYADSLCLMAARGNCTSPLISEINGVRFCLYENPMGIRSMLLTFGDNSMLTYENAQGEKCIPFGMCENRFGVFPEEGYAREVGSVPCPGNFYQCASSAAWQDDHTLLLDVQIIDAYFGRLWITLSFEGDRIHVEMRKVAEDFLWTYEGNAAGIREACMLG
ncbi:MAG: serine hydrolase [Clostridia bacterium]|nr:serine hydrolase [Clostridia bacterium]